MQNKYFVKGKELIKNRGNALFCIAIIIFLVMIFLLKENVNTTYIASNANDKIALSVDSVLTQHWLSSKKNMCGIKLAFAEIPEFDAEIIVQIINKEDKQVVRTATAMLSEIKDGNLEFTFEQYDCPVTTEFEISVYMRNIDNLIKENSSVWINVNTDYSGMEIDGESRNCALAAEVLYVKSSPVFVLFSILFTILIVTYSLMIICKREFAEVVGLGMLLIGLLLYLFGMLGELEYGIKFLQISLAFGLIYVLYNIWKGKCEIRKLLSFTMFGVCIFYLFSTLYNYSTIITDTDEYTHWALAVKDMFYSNQLPLHEGTSVKVTRYPPFMALIQYFFMYHNQVFSEKFLYMAYQFTGFCLLSTWFAGKEKKNFLWKGILYFITFLFPLILYPRFFNSIMIDGFLGVLFAYVLYCYVSEGMNKFNSFRIVAGLMALALTKEMGIVLAGIACFVFLCDQIYQKRKTALFVMLSGIATLVVFFSWQWYCYTNLQYAPYKEQALAGERLGSAISGTASVAGNNVSAWEYRIHVLLNGLLEIGNNIKIGPITCVTLLCVLLALIYFNAKKEKNKKMFFFFTVLEIGFFLYFLALIFIYIVVFSKEEALGTASFDRYLFSYLMGIIYVFIGFMVGGRLKIFCGDKALVISACVVIYFASTTEFLSLNQFVERKQDLIWGYDDLEEKVHSFMKKDEKIFFWCDNTTQMSYRIFTYTVSPLRTQVLNWSFRYSDTVTDTMKTYELEQIKATLSDFDYVYIADYDEKAEQVYMQLFKDTDEFEKYGIYKIDKDNDVLLEKIGYSPLKRVY